MARTVSVSAFVTRVRDDASRYLVDYMRATARHPGLLAREQTLEEWLRDFAAWVKAETKERRADSIEKTVRRKK